MYSKNLRNGLLNILNLLHYHEIRWGQYVTQNKILGINNDLIEKYIKYLANLRITQLGFKPIYHITENPLPWIDQFRTINNTKTDFFQKKPQTYAKRNELKW
jgi:ribonucleoside-diphosphate reductase beta chain